MKPNKQDPNEQQHHAFGDSKAAETLKSEIDKGAKYSSAIHLLNDAQTRSNQVLGSNIPNKKFWLQLVKAKADSDIEACGSDQIIKSLSRNVFTAKYRRLLKAIQ